MERFALSLGLFGAAVAAQANLIVNGGFEDLGDRANGHEIHFTHGTWGLYNTIPGWYTETAYDGHDWERRPIEVGRGTIYGVTGYQGKNVLELDSTGNANVSQSVLGLDAGQVYRLNFDYGRRAHTSPQTNEFAVLWNDHRVATFDPMSTEMLDASLDLVARGGKNELSFVAIGESDSYGGIIDDVRLNSVPAVTTPVPEPASLASFGVGLVGLIAARRKHR